MPIPPDLLPLFAKPLEGPFDLTLNHWDPPHLELSEHGRRATRLAVAWTMWEMTSMAHCHEAGPVTEDDLEPWKQAWARSGKTPESFPFKGRPGIRENLKWFDAVLGYSDVTLQALEPYIPEQVHRGVLQGGFEASEWKFAQRDWSDDGMFRFGMHGALNRRKEPFIVLQAFLELCEEHPEFKEGARLLLHTTVPSVLPEMNEIYERAGIGVRIWLETWDKARLEQYYQACHALVYPSHGEGKNLPGLEFSSTGGVVLGTDWSGHASWLTHDVGYPLACTVERMDGRPDLGKWAVVSIAEVKRAMWHVFTHRAEAKRKGELAARLIPQMCSWDAVLENLFRRLRDLVPGQGEIVHNLAMAARRDQVAESGVPVGFH